MWWPPIGGLVVGLGGLIDPKALGVGYGVIGAELAGKLALASLALLLVVKLVIWSVALGSGTSGGILAPLLMMYAALGGIIGHGFGGSSATWALMGMAGALAGVTRSPLTSIVFAFELTHDTGSLLPLLVVCTLAHLVSTLILKRSILTEKVARKGFHVMREYAVDHLELDSLVRRQRLYPVVSGDTLTGVIGWSGLSDGRDRTGATVDDLAHHDAIVAYPDETLRSAADRMASHELGALVVVDRSDRGRLLGVVTYFELLGGRRRQLVEEHHRQRPLRLRLPRRNRPEVGYPSTASTS